MSDGGTKEFAVNTPGGQVRLADLSFEVLERLEKETGRRWSELLRSPVFTAKSALAVYVAACESNGSTPVEPFTPRIIEEVYELVLEDTPVMYEDGLPKAEAGTSTSTSSGAPSDTAGPQT